MITPSPCFDLPQGITYLSNFTTEVYCHRRQDASTLETAHLTPRKLPQPCLSASPIQFTPILPLSRSERQRSNRTPQHSLPDRRPPPPPRLQIGPRLDQRAPRRAVQHALLHSHYHQARNRHHSPHTYRAGATADNRAIMHAFHYHYLIPHSTINSHLDPNPTILLSLNLEREPSKTSFLPPTSNPSPEASPYSPPSRPAHPNPLSPRPQTLAAGTNHPQHAHPHPAGTRVAPPDHQPQDFELQPGLVGPSRQSEVARVERVWRGGGVDRG